MEDKNQRLLDELLSVPTVSIRTPYYNYDFLKVTIGLNELAEFLLSKTTKLDDVQKEKAADRIMDLMHKHLPDEDVKDLHQKVLNIL